MIKTKTRVRWHGATKDYEGIVVAASSAGYYLVQEDNGLCVIVNEQSIFREMRSRKEDGKQV